MSRQPGALIRFASLSTRERGQLADLLDSAFDTSTFRVLENISTDKFLQVLDVFQGDRIKFPSYDMIERRITDIDIYHAVQSTKSIQEVAVRYGKPATYIQKIYDLVEEELIKSDEFSSDLNTETDSTQHELSALLNITCESNTFSLFEHILGNEFKVLLKAFENDRIKFPTVDIIEKKVCALKIYNDYIARKGNLKAVMRKWNKSKAYVIKVVESVRKDLESCDSDSL